MYHGSVTISEATSDNICIDDVIEFKIGKKLTTAVSLIFELD